MRDFFANGDLKNNIKNNQSKSRGLAKINSLLKCTDEIETHKRFFPASILKNISFLIFQ